MTNNITESKSKLLVVIIIAVMTLIVIVESAILILNTKQTPGLSIEATLTKTELSKQPIQTSTPEIEQLVTSSPTAKKVPTNPSQTLSREITQPSKGGIETTPVVTTFPNFSTQTITSGINASLREIPRGSIVFSAQVNFPNPNTEFYLMNTEGVQLAKLGTFTGSSAWSPDGTKLAIGCENVDQICILDMSDTGNIKLFPVKASSSLGNINMKIELPEECKQLLTPERGITSISWSRDGKDLAVVCKDHEAEQQITKVCVLDLEGNGHCWSDEKNLYIQKVAYSPVEDLFVVSRYGMIEITDLDGKTIQDLNTGINPVWSPDGKSIVFADTVDGGPRSGIAVISKDGKKLKWIYIQPINGKYEEFLCVKCELYSSQNEGRFSWSPDGNYVVFSAIYGGDYFENIFRMNIKTGEITILVGANGSYKFVSDPNWGPMDYR